MLGRIAVEFLPAPVWPLVCKMKSIGTFDLYTRDSDKMNSWRRYRTLLGRTLYVTAIALALLYAFSEKRKNLKVSEAMEEASRRFSVYLIAEGIQAYRDSTGALPATLGKIGLDEEGIAYRTDGSTYRLVTLEGPYSIVFVDGENTDQLKSAFAVLERGALR